MSSKNKQLEDEASDSDVDDNDEPSDNSDDEEDENQPKKLRVYLPSQPLSEGEELTYDSSAYLMYHQFHTGAPCLSFDIVKDTLGDARETFPLSCYVVTGTQTESNLDNSILLLKMSNLSKMKGKKNDYDDEDDESSDDDDVDVEPVLKTASFKHPGCVNRIRSCMIQNANIAASWSSEGSVHIWNISQLMSVVDNKGATMRVSNEKSQKPIFSFSGHQCEGFALDWCEMQPGRLATGDSNKNIHLWTLKDGSGGWNINQVPLTGHTASIEDIVWSPSEPNVMASCSADRSIRIWDVRCPSAKACRIAIIDAHDNDVNVISWNRVDGKFLLSGGDDGVIKVWDLSQYKKDTPLTSSSCIAKLKHHTAPITSLEWHPTDSTVFASSGEDDQLVIWDIAVEKDGEEEEDCDVLPQILFIHQGQKEVKELHWHKQLPGVVVSTALSGFDVFRTISC